jgi:hypothetical protein
LYVRGTAELLQIVKLAIAVGGVPSAVGQHRTRDSSLQVSGVS